MGGSPLAGKQQRTLIGILAALLVGLVTYHDCRHMWKAVSAWLHGVKLPVIVAASTALVAVRLPLVWWAYLTDRDALFWGAIVVGQLTFNLLYGLYFRTLTIDQVLEQPVK